MYLVKQAEGVMDTFKSIVTNATIVLL